MTEVATQRGNPNPPTPEKSRVPPGVAAPAHGARERRSSSYSLRLIVWTIRQTHEAIHAKDEDGDTADYDAGVTKRSASR